MRWLKGSSHSDAPTTVLWHRLCSDGDQHLIWPYAGPPFLLPSRVSGFVDETAAAAALLRSVICRRWSGTRRQAKILLFRGCRCASATMRCDAMQMRCACLSRYI